MRSFLALAGGLALAIFTLLTFSPVRAESTPAPDWKLTDLQGKPVSLADYKGKVIVLNFWATWCPPCVAEIPEFVALQKEDQGKNVAIIGLSVDSIAPTQVAAFAKKKDINYPVVMANDETLQKYGVTEGIPVTVIIDRNGNIVFRQLGMLEDGVLKAKVAPLLGTGH